MVLWEILALNGLLNEYSKKLDKINTFKDLVQRYKNKITEIKGLLIQEDFKYFELFK